MFYRSILYVGVLLFFVSQDLLAQTTTGTLGVTATVGSASTCVFDSVTPMFFPNYNPLDSHSDEATALITVTCNAGMPYDVALSEGNGVGATEDQRMMTEMAATGVELLPYDLFQNSNRTDNWGDIMEKDTMHMIGNNCPQQLTVYGKITANQVVEPGVYMDMVTVMITF